jgi:hypothetical protein
MRGEFEAAGALAMPAASTALPLLNARQEQTRCSF